MFQIANGDLVAVEARYHRSKGCLIAYLNPRNISAMSHEAKIEQNTHRIMQLLIEEFEKPIIEEKSVFLLSTLKIRFLELAKMESVEVSN